MFRLHLYVSRCFEWMGPVRIDVPQWPLNATRKRCIQLIGVVGWGSRVSPHVSVPFVAAFQEFINSIAMPANINRDPRI